MKKIKLPSGDTARFLALTPIMFIHPAEDAPLWVFLAFGAYILTVLAATALLNKYNGRMWRS